MGVIEETRQVLQDFIAPEFRAIDARLSALEKRIDGVDKRIDGLDNKIDRNHAEVMAAIHRIENYTAVLERLARLEAKMQTAA